MWVIANPSKHRDFEAFRADITARIRALTGEEARWETTTPEDPGTGAAVRAVAAGASRIIAAGGDGTVRAVAAGLAHTGVPLGILPEGTGNILARNLGIPLRSRADALRVALGESVEDVDLGWLRIEEGRVRIAFRNEAERRPSRKHPPRTPAPITLLRMFVQMSGLFSRLPGAVLTGTRWRARVRR